MEQPVPWAGVPGEPTVVPAKAVVPHVRGVAVAHVKFVVTVVS